MSKELKKLSVLIFTPLFLLRLLRSLVRRGGRDGLGGGAGGGSCGWFGTVSFHLGHVAVEMEHIIKNRRKN